jgi:hypothetical protein
VTPPPLPVETMLLRAPVPAGWNIESAEVDGEPIDVKDGDVVDLSGKTKPLAVRFKVKRS